MPKIERVTILVDPGRRARLARIAKAQGLSGVSELGRVALDEYERRHTAAGKSVFDPALQFGDEGFESDDHDEELYGDKS